MLMLAGLFFLIEQMGRKYIFIYRTNLHDYQGTRPYLFSFCALIPVFLWMMMLNHVNCREQMLCEYVCDNFVKDLGIFLDAQKILKHKN